jgi:translation initiation factor IF-3
MKAKASSDGEKIATDALKALRRAAKKAVELAALRELPPMCRIVDIAKRKRKTRKNQACTSTHLMES